MKLILAVLDVSLTMEHTRCYKTERFFTFMKVYAYAVVLEQQKLKSYYSTVLRITSASFYI